MPWAELTDVRCYYEWSGQGEPALLIGGLSNSIERWDPIIPALTRHFCILRCDPRDLGRSVARRPAASLAHYAADVIELLDYLQLDRVHVAGLSWGGVLAQRLASDHPGRVNRLVLISCTDRFSIYLREMGRLVSYVLRRGRWPMFLRLMELLGSGPVYLDADPAAMEARLKEKMYLKVSRQAVARQLKCMMDCDRKGWREPLSAPTLVVAGEYDPLIPHCYARAMARAIPGSRFVLLEDAGHNPVEECPERLLAEMLPFLRGRSARLEKLKQAALAPAA